MSTTFADRALVFLETGSLPDGFTPITTALPTDDKPVVALRKSSYSGAKFEVITARYMPAYRPLSPWRDLQNACMAARLVASGAWLPQVR